MKKYLILIFLLFNFSLGLYAQVDNLVYARQLSKGVLIHFRILNDQYKVCASQHELFLLNKENQTVDSLLLKSNFSNRNPLQYMEPLDDSTVSVTTMQNIWVVRVRDGKFKTIYQEDIDKDFRKKHEDGNRFYATETGGIIYLTGKQKKKENNLSWNRKEKNDEIARLTKTCAITKDFNWREYNFAYYDTFDGSNMFVNYPDCNKAHIINLKTNEVKQVLFPETADSITYQYLLNDRKTKQLYLIQFNETNGMSYIFKYDPKKNTISDKVVTDIYVEEIYDAKIHISGMFDQSIGHYYIPLNGEVKPKPIILDRIDVNYKKDY